MRADAPFHLFHPRCHCMLSPPTLTTFIHHRHLCSIYFSLTTKSYPLLHLSSLAENVDVVDRITRPSVSKATNTHRLGKPTGSRRGWRPIPVFYLTSSWMSFLSLAAVRPSSAPSHPQLCIPLASFAGTKLLSSHVRTNVPALHSTLRRRHILSFPLPSLRT